jgi:tRNA A-37 threonylcarbamoyl transferase component Bud32
MALDRPLGSRYLLHAMIGQGAMGQVYRASVRGTGQPVAVKVLKPDLVTNPDLVARFLQERTILTSVSSPHVVQVEDLVVEGETVAIVMEFVEGSNLRSHLRVAGGCLPPAEAVRLTSQLLAGAAAVHAAGIVHRDIKPENSLLDTAGERQLLKLTDFGISKLAYGASLTKLTSLIGTPEYMSPEAAEARPATAASDMYSAGIVLYEMLAGHTPFTGGHPLAILRRQVDQPPPPILGLPRWLSALIQAMLAKDPADRPSSAAAVSDELREREHELAGLPALPSATAPSFAASQALPSTAGTPGREPAEQSRPAAAQHPPQLRARVRLQPSEADALRVEAAGSGAGGRPGRVSAPGGMAVDEGWGMQSGNDPVLLDRGWRPKRGMGMALLAAAAVVVLLIAGAVGFALSRPHNASAQTAQGARAVSYSFPPVRYPDGMLLSRKWTLSGKNGSVLTETDLAINGTRKRLKNAFADPIPAAVTTSLRAIHFTPPPEQIIISKRAAVWKMLVPAGGETPAGYRAAVAPDGVSLARLHNMVNAFAPLLSSAPGPKATIVRIASLALAPASLTLATGSREQLALTGRLADGKPAPASLLQAAAWASANPEVAAVSPSGLVTGTGTGTTTVTAQIGPARAFATVTATSKSTSPGPAKATTKSPASGTATGGIKITLTAAPAETTSIVCAGTPVTVTAAVTSGKAATITYQWLLGGVAEGSAKTAAVSAGKALHLTYAPLDPGSPAVNESYAPTVGLDITSPTKVSESLPLSYSCESGVYSGTIDSTCTPAADDYACFEITLDTTSTQPVSVTWELLQGATLEDTSTLTVSGEVAYDLPVMLGADTCAGSPCAAGTYTAEVTATGTTKESKSFSAPITVSSPPTPTP